MATSSAEPPRLTTFVTNARTARESAEGERSAVNSLYATVLAGSSYRQVQVGSLAALATALESMGANETFVATVRDAVLAADVNGGGVVTIDDTQILAALAAAGAGAPPTPVQFDPASMIGQPPTSGFVDDPICAANGNMVHQDTDVLLPAIAGALTITRTWNSLAHDRPGAFGPGWSSMLDVRLDVIGPTAVTAHLADGAAVGFIRADHGWTTPARRFVTLHSDGAGFVLQIDPVRQLRFAPSGTLTGWTVGVARVTVTRDADGRVIGLHESVTGRSLAVAWAGGRVESLLLDDGRTVRYERDEHGVAHRVSTEAGGLTYRYDGTWLTAVVDPDGVAAFVNEYDELGRVARQTSPFGRVTAYRYEPTGITVISGDDGLRQAMVHDSVGQLTAVVDADGSAMRLTYDDVGHVVGVVERDGTSWRYEYDERGDLVRRVDPDGGEQRWTWDDQHRMIAETNRAGATWHMEFEGDHRAPARVIGPDGAVSHQTLDHRGLPIQMVDADGVVEGYEWDRDGQLVAVIDGLGGRRTIAYDGRGHVTRMTPADGEPTTLDLDHAGRVLRRVRGDEVSTFDYTTAGRCRGGSEPGDVGWSATFADHGAVATVHDALGSTVGFDYDPMGNVVAVTAPDGAVYRNRFDAVGRHVAAVDPTGAATTKSYDRRGQLVGLTEPGGGQWRRELDVLGRTIVSIAPDGTATRWTYHPAGEVATVTGHDGRTWSTEVDAEGRPVAVVDPTGGRAEIEYTAAGRVRRRRSPAGRVEAFEYDPAGRLAGVTGVDGVRREFGRDARGFLTSVNSPERTVSYRWDDGYRLIGVITDEDGGEARTSVERDAGGRVVSTTDPAMVKARFSWDERGLMSSATDPAGLLSRFTRDDRGRLGAQTTPGERTMRLSYGADGRLDGLIDPTGARTDYSRDANGHVVGLRRTDGSGWDRRLDPLGREIERTDADGASLGRFRYDVAGRMTQAIGDGAGVLTSFLWDDNDAVVGIETAEGVATIERDADGWVAAHTGVDGVRVTYERDEAGRIRAVRIDGEDVDLPEEDPGVRDLAGRLTIGRDGTVHRYDVAGRLVELAPALSTPTRFTYGLDGLVETEDGPDGRRRFGYDDAGRVVTVTIEGVGTTTIDYDVTGRRLLERRPDGSAVRYGWDGADRLAVVITETADGGVRELSVTYDAFGRPVLVGDIAFGYDPVAGGCDREGDRRFVNVGSWRYDLATRVWEVPGLGRPAGGIALTGSLVAVGARVLDRTTRQFLSADPLLAVAGSNGSASGYTYAWHDPVNYVDPSGLRPISMEEYDAIRTQQEQGRVGQAWEAIKSDPWGTLAMVGVAALGVGLMFVPGGQVIGAGILIGLGTSAAVGFATGTFSPTAVAIGGAVGAIPGGSTFRGAVMIGAASGAGETTVGSVLTGQGLPSLQQLAVGTAMGGGGGAATQRLSQALTARMPTIDAGAGSVPASGASTNASAVSSSTLRVQLAPVGSTSVTNHTPTPRLAQDVRVNPNAPAPLPLNRPVGLSATQNQYVQDRIQGLAAQGATDFRVNQQQVDINGTRVGINRPDLQYSLNGERVYEEFDVPPSTRAPTHQVRLEANDPAGRVELFEVS